MKSQMRPEAMISVKEMLGRTDWRKFLDFILKHTKTDRVHSEYMSHLQWKNVCIYFVRKDVESKSLT